MRYKVKSKGLKIEHFHFLTVTNWAKYLVFIKFNFLICSRRSMPNSQGSSKDQMKMLLSCNFIHGKNIAQVLFLYML